MGSVMEPAWKETGTPEHLGAAYPNPDGFARVFRHLELYRPVCLALYDRHAVAHPVSDYKIGDLQSNESPLVPRRALLSDSGELNFGHELSSIRPSRSMSRHCVDWVILRKEAEWQVSERRPIR